MLKQNRTLPLSMIIIPNLIPNVYLTPMHTTEISSNIIFSKKPSVFLQ